MRVDAALVKATAEAVLADFDPGFRLSLWDVLVLIVSVALASYLWSVAPVASLLLLFVIGHFFLFCNLLRMSRVPELVWAGSFVLLAGASLRLGVPPWWLTFGLSLCITLLLALYEIGRPGYHGIFWQRWNPKLPAWFDKSQQDQPPGGGASGL